MKNNKKGFTIVELVIVIAIIAILAAVLIPTFSNVIGKANESKCLQAAKTTFEDTYAQDAADGDIDGKIGNNNVSTVASGAGIKTYTASNQAVTKYEYTDGTYTTKYESNTWTTSK